ncbi:MAG: hypothetical protein ACNA8W_05890 [Bradymonadaceae bacterium]
MGPGRRTRGIGLCGASIYDIKHLSEVIDDDERQAARQAVQLIEERGFHRRRDLQAMLETYLQQ